MASYPTAVKSFTSKNDGVDYPQAAHVNDLQDEVQAIEDGLINGLQHGLTISTGGLTISTGGLRVGGQSTLASLSVTGGVDVVGGSTFGTINAGASTFNSVVVTGALTATGTVTGNFDVRPSVLLRNTSNTVLAAGGTFIGLEWKTILFDTHGMHSTTTNSSRITFAHSTGSYCVGANIPVTMSAQNFMRSHIRYNDSTVLVAGASAMAGGGDLAFHQNLSGLLRVADLTDYVTVRAWSTGSNVLFDSTVSPLVFWAYKVSS